MAVSRKDPKGRKLRDGESWRSDHRYSYRYTDARTGKRHTIYAAELPELREKEKQLAQDLDENILCDTAVKKMTLNDLFARYIEIREIGDTTKSNYMKTWNNRVRDDIGQMKVVMILPSQLKHFTQSYPRPGTLTQPLSILTILSAQRWKWRWMMILSVKTRQRGL